MRIINESIPDSDFSGQNLAKANFKRSDLSNCSFVNSNCTDAVFTLCDLSGASFDGAILDGATFHGAKVSGTNFIGATYSGVKITKGPVGLAGMEYAAIVTDVFTQLGCKIMTNQEWLDATDEIRSLMDSENPEKPNEFWYSIVDEYTNILNSWR